MNLNRILIITDKKEQYQWIVSSIFSDSRFYKVDFAQQISSTKKYLSEQDYDLIISTYYFEDGTCFDFMDLLQEIPFILIIPEENEDIAISVLKNGAFNYLIEDPEKRYIELLSLLTEKALIVNQERKRNRKLANAIEHASDSIFFVNSKEEISFVNKAFCLNYQYKSHEIIGKSVYYIWPKEEWQKMKQNLASLEKDLSPFETIHFNSSPAPFAVLVSASCFVDNHEEIMIFASTNITPIKQTQYQLENLVNKIKSSEENLTKILNHLDIGILLTTKENLLLFVNSKLSQILSIDPSKLDSKYWNDYFTPEQTSLIESSKDLQPVKVSFENKNKHKYYFSVSKIEIAPDSQKVYFFQDETEMVLLRNSLQSQNIFMDILGKSESIKKVLQLIQNIAAGSWTVLIQGETGTGKELAAKAIHYSSPLKDKPFITVNLNSLNETLIYSQLFGHKKGAFTGATSDQKGFLESAEGGTLFLDEIGDIPESVQLALLRVLENKEYIKLGEANPRKINVRILAATHKDLLKLSEGGLFRKDLYYRIQVARIFMPPLRERTEDIPLLANYFLDQATTMNHRNIHSISHEALRLLIQYQWPGNIRELKNAIEYSVISCQTLKIMPSDLPPEIQQNTIQNTPSQQYPEKVKIEEALIKSNGRKDIAAKILGISRATFFRKLKKYNIVSF